MQMSSQQQQQQQSHHFTGPPHQQQPDGRQFGRPPPQQQQIGAGGGQFGQQQFVEPLTNLDSKVPSGKLQYFPAGNQPPTSQLQPDPDGYPMCQQSQQFTTVGGGGPPQQQQMSFMGEIDDFGVTDDFLSLQQTQQIQKVSRTGDSNGVTVGQQQQTAAYQAQSFQNFQQQLYSIGTTGNSTVSQQPRDNF